MTTLLLHVLDAIITFAVPNCLSHLIISHNVVLLLNLSLIATVRIKLSEKKVIKQQIIFVSSYASFGNNNDAKNHVYLNLSCVNTEDIISKSFDGIKLF